MNLMKETLLFHFLPNRNLRKSLKTPYIKDLDMSTSCVCCNEKIDIGYACSFCLSIYCKKGRLNDHCRMCGKKLV